MDSLFEEMTSKVQDDAGINTNLYRKNPYLNSFANKSMTQSDLAHAVVESNAADKSEIINE